MSLPASLKLVLELAGKRGVVGEVPDALLGHNADRPKDLILGAGAEKTFPSFQETAAMRILTFLSVLFLTAGACADPVYLQADAPVEARVRDLLGRMTLAEKVGQMTQLNLTVYNSSGEQADVDVVQEKFIPLVRDYHVGSFLNGAAVAPDVWASYGETIQRLNLEHSRLKIPLIYGVDHVHGANYLTGATIFPQPINLAATFRDQHAKNMAEVTASEVADLGHHWIFAPILDIAVNPYWPRFYETFGEEPTVAARMGSAYVRALQEAPLIEPYKLAATAKHFLGYSNSDSGWDRTPAQIPDQYLQEFFVPPFAASIRAGVKTVMINSAEINGIPTHANPKILQKLLREQLGFQGVAVTDWEDILYLVSRHKVARDEREATKMALDAGVDMSMTAVTTTFPGVVMQLVKDGEISEERIDRSVARILALKFELGLFEHPFPRVDRFDRIGSDASQQLAQQAADESLVLLKNDGTLPLGGGRKVAVIGAAADSKRILSGGWTLNHQGKSEEFYPQTMMTVSQALEKEFGGLVAPGQADLVVAVIAEQPYAEGSGDIVDLNFPPSELDTLKQAVETGKPVALVILAGRPRVIGPLEGKVSATIWAGLPGFEGASSIAGVLSGRINPSGKLPFNYPSSPGHNVTSYHKNNERDTSLYRFGHGLSYTSFEYDGLQVSGDVATVTVTNSGKRAGRESVLWFLTDEVGRVTRPVRRLVDYSSCHLAPGQTEKLTLRLSQSHFTYPDAEGRPQEESGWYELRVGPLKARLEKKF